MRRSNTNVCPQTLATVWSKCIAWFNICVCVCCVFYSFERPTSAPKLTMFVEVMAVIVTDPLYAQKAESDNRNAIAWNGKVQSIDCIEFPKQFSLGWTNKNLFDLQKINRHTKDIKRRQTTYYTVRADEWNREKYLHYPITNFEHNRECTQNNVQQQRRWVCEWSGAEWTGADLLMNTTVYTARDSSHDENCIYLYHKMV